MYYDTLEDKYETQYLDLHVCSEEELGLNRNENSKFYPLTDESLAYLKKDSL